MIESYQPVTPLVTLESLAMEESEQAVRAHIRHLELLGRSKLTVYHRRRALIRLAGSLAVALLDATAADLYEWRSSLTASDATIAGYVSHVREFYDFCVHRGFLPASPAAGIPVPPSPRREPRPISEKDLLRAVTNADGRVRIWLVLAGWCGLRAKEIALLRAESVRLRDERPSVRVTWDATKGRRERVIPLSAFVVSELEAAGLPATGLVFPRFDGQPLRPWVVSKACNTYLHDHGIADTLHSLRHRFATQAYHVEHDLRTVQELLGHAHIQTTAGYAAVDREAFARTVNALPAPRRRKTAL